MNTAALCIPAMVVSRTIRQQQEKHRREFVGPFPTIDHKAREQYVEYYVNELIAAGFDVVTWHDFIDDSMIVQVRKGNIGYRTSISYVYFMDDLCLSYEIRQLVNKVENEIYKLKGEEK